MPTRKAEIREGLYWLQQDGIIVFPTDTVCGVGASLASPKAIKRLYTAKERPAEQATAILISSIDQIQWVSDQALDQATQAMLLNCWPGPLTILLKRRHDTPYAEGLDLICGPADKVGVRVPHHALVIDLIQMLGHPLVASSANIKGQEPPYDPAETDPDFVARVDAVLHDKPGDGEASTVLDLTTDPYTLVRPGPISPQDLQRKPERQTMIFAPDESH